MYVGGTLKSTGGAIPPTFHMREDGEIMAYVRPFFREGATVGLFLKMSGIKAAVERGEVQALKKGPCGPLIFSPSPHGSLLF